MTRIKSLFAMMLLLTMVSCNKPKKSEFLYLTPVQLKYLGIHVYHNGVYYKNMNPAWRQDSSTYCFLEFKCNNSNYLSTTLYTEEDIAAAKEKGDSNLTQDNCTKFDFYPLLIGNTTGNMSYDSYSVKNKDMKLLPVAINMSEAKTANRVDTIVVWFKPTESIKKALPKDVNLENYLKVPKVAI